MRRPPAGHRPRRLAAAVIIAALSTALCAGAALPAPGGPLPGDSVLRAGEELTYNVSYAGIDIGQVRLTILDAERSGGKTVYHATARIDSYRGIPFVDLHVVYESTISESLYTHRFRSRLKDGRDWKYFVYDFDYPGGAVYIEEGMTEAATVRSRDTLDIDTLTQDGLSLFYRARAHVRSRHAANIPVVVGEAKGNAYIDFLNERCGEEIDAVGYPVETVRCEGRADFVGVFGLTGDFEGWFSNDRARIPILAKMKVILGNIRVELMKWNREGWTPPRYEKN